MQSWDLNLHLTPETEPPLSASGIVNNPLLWNAQTRRVSIKTDSDRQSKKSHHFLWGECQLESSFWLLNLFLDPRRRGWNHFTTRAQRCNRQEGTKALSHSEAGQEELSPTQVIKASSEGWCWGQLQGDADRDRVSPRNRGSTGQGPVARVTAGVIHFSKSKELWKHFPQAAWSYLLVRAALLMQTGDWALYCRPAGPKQRDGYPYPFGCGGL